MSFRANIRQYNSAFALTSLGVNIDRETVQGRGIASFHIHGEVYHQMGSLLPQQGSHPVYAQLYIYDPRHANDLCFQRNPNLNHQVMAILHDMSWNHHPYIRLYKRAHNVIMELPVGQHGNVRVRLHFTDGIDH